MKRLLVASTRTAKILLNAGFVVVDIKPHKSDPKRRTAFIFEDTEQIREFIKLNSLEV